MQVGDLVDRWRGHFHNGTGRVGLLVEQLPKDFTRGRTTGDWFVVQWADGGREAIRFQYLEVLNASR